MSFSTKWYYLKETFTSLKRNSLMSIASVTTVALSILVLGLFLTMVLNVNNLAQYLENQVQVTVYMSDAATSVQRRQVEQQLKTTRGVMEVKGVTKEEALQNFKKRLREQEKLLDALGEDNPFPYSFEVQVDKPERIQYDPHYGLCPSAGSEHHEICGGHQLVHPLAFPAGRDVHGLCRGSHCRCGPFQDV